jgi:hypothetical protein
MPWGYNPETQEVFGYSGPKAPDTIEYHQKQIDAIWWNYDHGMVYMEPQDAMYAAQFHVRRIRELRDR